MTLDSIKKKKKNQPVGFNDISPHRPESGLQTGFAIPNLQDIEEFDEEEARQRDENEKKKPREKEEEKKAMETYPCDLGQLRDDWTHRSLEIFNTFHERVDWKDLPSDYLQMTFKAIYFHKKGDFLSSLIFAALTLWVVKVKGKSGNPEISTIKEEMAKLVTSNRNKIIEQYRQEAQKDDNKDGLEFEPVDVKTLTLKGSDKKLTFNELAGMYNEKGQMNTKFIYPNIYKWLFSREENNVLLYGPPGTGKTVLAKAAAVEFASASTNLNIKFINADASSLRSKWEGGTEKNIAKLFEEANRVAIVGMRETGIPTKVIIFLDEIEQLAADRTDDKNNSGRSVTTLLQQMDGFVSKGANVMVLAATNLPWELDSAILRRFAGRIMVDLPDYTARVQVLTDKLLGKYLDRDDVKATQEHRIKNSVLITTVDEAVGETLKECVDNKRERLIRNEETAKCMFDESSFQSYLHIVMNGTLWDYAIKGHEQCAQELLDKINNKYKDAKDTTKSNLSVLFNNIAAQNVIDLKNYQGDDDITKYKPGDKREDIFKNYKNLSIKLIECFNVSMFGSDIQLTEWYKKVASVEYKKIVDKINEATDVASLKSKLQGIKCKEIYINYINAFTAKYFYPDEIWKIMDSEDVTMMKSPQFKHLTRLVMYLHYLGEVTGPSSTASLLQSNAFIGKRTSHYAKSKFGYSNADIQELMNEFHGILGTSIVTSMIHKQDHALCGANNTNCYTQEFIKKDGNYYYSQPDADADLASAVVVATSKVLMEDSNSNDSNNNSQPVTNKTKSNKKTTKPDSKKDNGSNQAKANECYVNEPSDAYVTFREKMFNEALESFKTTTGDSLDLPDMWEYAMSNTKPVKGQTKKDNWELYNSYGFV